ncbi:MAG TPA: large conductance mechanosensitive channel protein MscL [Pseudogracilibacillus sp.]|nr:large conductance mechanosensitive channel protein MscL [Pseudogracilibacillus sp.]
MWKDFKEFAIEGNLIDLAVAVIIGGAFGQIVSSLVEDIIVPLIGILLNGVNIEHLVFLVGSAELRYGIFLQSVLDFFIIALSIFFFLRLVLRKKSEVEEEEEEEISSEEQLLTEIRDLLKEQNRNGA